jgi:hypothetical protein
MSERNLEGLSERERACLAHLEEAQKLGVSFSRYCREKKLSMYQWTWIKRALVRKGVIGGRRRAEEAKPAGFVPVHIVPAAVAPATSTRTVCRIRHPSGWTIECASYPAASWMLALMLGEAA